MLASLRTHRPAALLVVLSLGLGIVAPAVVCTVAMACTVVPAPDASAMEMGEGPCPAHSGVPKAPTERPPAAPSHSDCCVAALPMAPVTEKTVVAPAAAGVALLGPFVVSAPASAPAAVPRAVPRPPAPPGPLHLLYGVFLT